MLIGAVHGLSWMGNPGSSTIWSVADMPRSVVKVLSGLPRRTDWLDVVASGIAMRECTAWCWAEFRLMQTLRRLRQSQHVDSGLATRLEPWLTDLVNSVIKQAWLSPYVYGRQTLQMDVDWRCKRRAVCDNSNAETRLTARAVEG